jgi:hypothetical protein
MAAAAASESLLQRLVINLQAVCMRFKDKLALDKVRRCVGGGGYLYLRGAACKPLIVICKLQVPAVDMVVGCISVATNWVLTSAMTAVASGYNTMVVILHHYPVSHDTSHMWGVADDGMRHSLVDALGWSWAGLQNREACYTGEELLLDGSCCLLVPRSAGDRSVYA